MYSSSLLALMDEAAFDSKAFLTDVLFKNYQAVYNNLTELVNGSICRNNRAFGVPSTALELIGSHHLSNTSCYNC